MSVNEKIRLIRETKGLTQEQVAEKLGVSPTVYGDIERGDTDPKLSKLEKIAEILEIRLSELVDFSDKGTLNIYCYKKGKQRGFYFGSSNSELEKQQLVIELKDKELALQQREIAYLKELNELLKSKTRHD